MTRDPGHTGGQRGRRTGRTEAGSRQGEARRQRNSVTMLRRLNVTNRAYLLLFRWMPGLACVRRNGDGDLCVDAP